MSDVGMQMASFMSSKKTANLAKLEGEIAGEMEGVAALQRETDRKLNLTKAISTQRAMASGAGIDVATGSPILAVEQLIADEKTDTERDKFNSRIAAQTARYKGLARSGGIMANATVALAKAGVSSAQSYMAGRKADAAKKEGGIT